MLHTLGLRQPINLVRKRITVIVNVDEEFLQLRESSARVQARRGVNLDTIARRKNNGFLDNAPASQQLQDRRHARMGDRETLAQCNWRGMMA